MIGPQHIATDAITATTGSITIAVRTNSVSQIRSCMRRNRNIADGAADCGLA